METSATASTEWTSDDIDRVFEAVRAAVFDAAPIDNVVEAINAANASSVWPDVILEDTLDAEHIDG